MTEGDAYAKGFEQYEINEVVEIFAKYAKISNADEQCFLSSANQRGDWQGLNCDSMVNKWTYRSFC